MAARKKVAKKKPHKSAGGRPKFEITPEILKQVELHAAQGLNNEQIAHTIGMGESTLYRYQAENEEFRETIKRGKAKGIAVIANALYEKAKNGDTVAQIFFLKNRASDEWMDRKAIEHDVTHHHEVDDLTDEELTAIARGGGAGADRPKGGAKPSTKLH